MTTDFTTMDLDALSEHFHTCLETRGARVAFEWLVEALSAQSPNLRSANVRLLPYTGIAEGLDWLEAHVDSPVTESWGVAAALLGVSWSRIALWASTPTARQLMALDALLAYRAPAPNMAPLHQIAGPTLPVPPTAAELDATLTLVLETRRTPRVRQAVAAIRIHMQEILRNEARAVPVGSLPQLYLDPDKFDTGPAVMESHNRATSQLRGAFQALVARFTRK